jgi:YcxB-like protein
MELTFTLTEQDLRRARFSMAFAQLWPWRGLQLAAAAILFACIVEVLQANQTGPEADLSGAAIRGIGYGLLLALAFPLLLYFAAFYGARQQLSSKANTSGPFAYNFSNEAIIYSGPTGHGETQWSAYPWIRETKHQFLLYPQKNLAYPIPKKCFVRPVDLESFRDLLRTNHTGALRLLS